MGADDGAPFLRPSRDYTHSLQSIRGSITAGQPVSEDPLVAVDVSIWINQGLSGVGAVSEYHASPPVPVTSIAKYVLEKARIVRQSRFRPVLVFDGSRNPAKADENAHRPHKVATKERELQNAHREKKLSLDAVQKLRKGAMRVRPDILFEVVEMAKKEGIMVVGAPFEADHQLKSLLDQGIVDFVLTEDSDIPYFGCDKTIMRLSQKGKCCLVKQYMFLKEAFPKHFDVERDIMPEELVLFSLLLGNDYVKRVPGEGKKASVDTMKRYVRLSSEEEKDALVAEHIKKLKGKFPEDPVDRNSK
jgi:exonuclease-1